MSYFDVVLTKSPLEFYKLDDLAAIDNPLFDSVRNVNGGVTSNVSYRQDSILPSEPDAKSMLFGATSSYAVVTARAAQMSATWAGDAWINPTSLYGSDAANSAPCIIAHDDDGVGLVWRLYIEGSTGALTVVMQKANGSYVSCASAAGLIQVNTSAHVAISYDGNVVTLYHNGVSVGSLAVGALYPVASNPGYRIGATKNLSVQSVFQGRIQDVGFYDHSLSASDVTDLYDAGLELPEVLNPPIGLSILNLRGTSADVYWDASGAGVMAESYEYSLNGAAPVAWPLGQTLTLNALTPSTAYEFRVRSLGSGLTSDWATANFTTSAGNPSAPTNVTFSNVTNVGATVNWTPGSGGAPVTGFEYQVNSLPAVSVSSATVSAALSGLSSNSAYTFKMRAVSETGASDWVSGNFTTKGPPGSVGTLSVSNVTATSARISWVKPSDAGGYRYVVDNSDPISIGDVDYVDISGLAPEVEHTVQVQALNAYGSSSMSTVSFSTLVGIPNPPVGLNITSSTSTSATASWSDPTTGSPPTNYQYQLDNDAWVDLAANTRSVTVDDLLPGTQHTLRIRSKNNIGTSSSIQISFTLNPGPAFPPADLAAYQITQSEATLKWTQSLLGPAPLSYEYSIDFSEVVNVGPVLMAIVSGLEAGTSHSFRVRAVGEFGTSDWSETSFTTNPPDVPVAETRRISWNDVGKRYFETGIDRGVLYLSDNRGVAWDGLTGMEEDLGDESTEPFYMDGVKYLDVVSMGDYTGTLRAIMYPDEFLAYEGYSEMGSGVYADDQASDIFGLSYRTLVGNDVESDDFGYKIHLVYNLSAYPDSVTHATTQDVAALSEFGWTISSVPVHVPGYRPTAHVIMDTRYMNKYILRDIEDILYGTPDTQPRLPSILELMGFVEDYTFVEIIDNGDGTWTARGPSIAFSKNDPTWFRIENSNARYVDDGTYIISTG